MDPLKGIPQIIQPAIQQTAPPVTEMPTQSAGFESSDTLETSQASALTELQPNNLIGSSLESDLESLHGVLNEVSGKLGDLQSHGDAIKNKLDSMSEMGETESLRLQMAMDRMSKMMSTLSNIMKKLEGTADNITKNLK